MELIFIVNEIEVLGLLILQLPPRQLVLRACTLNTILSEQHLSAIQTVHKHKCTFGNESVIYIYICTQAVCQRCSLKTIVAFKGSFHVGQNECF